MMPRDDEGAAEKFSGIYYSLREEDIMREYFALQERAIFAYIGLPLLA